jgi:hypothetical protein
MKSEIERPDVYTRKLEQLQFDEQQIVMRWMARCAVHELALEPDMVLPTDTLVSSLAQGLDCYPQQIFYGLQWAKEAGFIDDFSHQQTSLLPQPH